MLRLQQNIQLKNIYLKYSVQYENILPKKNIYIFSYLIRTFVLNTITQSLFIIFKTEMIVQ